MIQRTKESIPSLMKALHIFDYNVPLIAIVRRSASPFSCIINMSQLDFNIASLSQEHFGKRNREQYQEFFRIIPSIDSYSKSVFCSLGFGHWVIWGLWLTFRLNFQIDERWTEIREMCASLNPSKKNWDINAIDQP